MGVFNELGRIFGDALLPMEPTAHLWGIRIFGALAVVTIAMTGIRIFLGLERNGIVALARRMFFLSVLFGVVLLSRQITSVAINSSQQLATAMQAAAGVQPIVFHQPSSALESFASVSEQAQVKVGLLFSWGTIGASIPMMFGMVVMWIAQLLFAVTLLRYLVEAYMVRLLVPVLSGFAAWSGTAGIAEASLSYLMRFSVRLVVMLIVASLAPAVSLSLINYINVTGLNTWGEMFAAAGAFFAFAVIVPGLPALVGRGMANISVPVGSLLR